jgi:hypothetical protein
VSDTGLHGPGGRRTLKRMTQTPLEIELFDDETLADAGAVQHEDDDPESLVGDEVDDDLGLFAGEVHR